MSCGRLFLAILLALNFALAENKESSEKDSLFMRLKNTYSSNISLDTLNFLVQGQLSDGSWIGPKYHEKGHTPIEHLQMAKLLAEGYEHSCEEDALSFECNRIKETLLKSLQFWFNHQDDFVSDNWWMNEIGIQRELAPIAFLSWNNLPNFIKNSLIKIFPESPSRNGTNRTWISELVVMRGILEQRDSLIRLGLKNIEQTMLVTNQEGHQEDHSFFMHGNLLYNGGYGKVALSIAAKWAAICRGTNFSFSKESIDAMSALALEGNRWMMWKGMVDPMTLGREISRKGGNKDASSYRIILENLMSVDSVHSNDYKYWLREIDGENFLSGCHYFERGKLMVCRSNDYYVSLKMSSKNTVGSECINRENRKGFWLGAGILSVYRHPDDYKDIYPLWDWSMLPGVTSFSQDEQKEKRVTNQSEMVAGIAEEHYGVATMLLNRDSIFARKTWFFVDGSIIALGNDISSDKNLSIKTTLDQRLLATEPRTALGNVRKDVVETPWLWHDSLFYWTLDGKKFKVSIQQREANWNSIGSDDFFEKGDVLSLWLDHEIHPDQASYAYAIELCSSVETSPYLDANLIVLHNDSLGQIVLDKRNHVVGGIVFHAGILKLGNFEKFFEFPCIFLLREENGFLRELSKKNLSF